MAILKKIKSAAKSAPKSAPKSAARSASKPAAKSAALRKKPTNVVEKKNEKSVSQVRKKEFQRRKYNKDNKKKQEDEDSDFEIVPNQKTLSQFDSEDDEESDSSDLEVDMFNQYKDKKPSITTASTNKSAPKVEIKVSESDDEQDEKFIASETMAANRKNKKSGGFQSMGKIKWDRY